MVTTSRACLSELCDSSLKKIAALVHIKIHAIGKNMPAWVVDACNSYTVRMPREFDLSVNEYPQSRDARKNSGSASSADSAAIKKEGEQLLGALQARDYVVALDVGGKSLSTGDLAKKLQQWQLAGRNISLLIGGPDGLAAAVKTRADYCWSLSDLTLPHPLVRVILLEQLYRAHSILINHPYHRE